MARKMGSIDLQGNDFQKARAHYLASAPSSPVDGQQYHDSTTHTTMIYDSGAASWYSTRSTGVTYGTPGNSAVGDTAAAGSATTVARSDHVHGREAFGAITAQTTYGAALANGTATTVARSDHTHGTPSLTAVTPSASAVGDSAAVGTGTAPAREDHKHAREAFGLVTAQTAFGATSANGSAATLARSDHAHGTPTHIGTDHASISISSLAAPTGDVAWGSHKITGLLDPTGAQDAATKNYVDALSAGIAWKDSVATVYTTNLAGTYANGTAGVGATITEASNGALGANDGYTPVAGDRVLLAGQTTTANNGIYVVTAAGSAGAPYVLTRATDSDADTDIRGTSVSVDNGTTNGGTVWHLTTTGAITVGTTGLAFSIWTGATAATAGAGLTASGNVFNVGAGAGIVVNADNVTVDRATNGSKVPFIYAQTIGDGAASSFTITHSLGSTDVTVTVFNISTGAEELYDVTHTSTTQITVAFPFVPASNSYRVVVLG